jgi:periplasmic protein TonB
MRFLRWPLVLLMALVANSVLFLAVPVLNILFFDESVQRPKASEGVREVEVLVQQKKQEAPKKTIRAIQQANPFKATFQGAAQSQMRGFQMDLSLATGEGSGDGVAVGGGGMGNVVYEAGEVDEEARLLKEVPAKYPVRAQKQGVSGHVKMFLVINAQGMVSDMQVLSVEPPGFGFEQEAMASIRQWRFAPAQLNGFPVAQKATKEFNFVQ